MVEKSFGAKAVCWIATAILGLSVNTAFAVSGQSVPWQKGMQEPATDMARQIMSFHDGLLWVITAIVLFVLALLIVVVVRFNEKTNPKPSKMSHNTTVEVLWTVVPIIILVLIAVPSFKLLFRQYDFPKADLTIKAIGHQWYWSHEYPDFGAVKFDSLLLEGKDFESAEQKGLKPVRMLSVDNEVIVPAGKVVHVLITADDVIHSWTMPSFGVNSDAVPGRTTAVWFKVDQPGIYFGDCTQLCGSRHAYMPIAVRVVKEDVFNAWAAAAKAKDKSKAKAIIEQAALDQIAASASKLALAPAQK